MAEAADAKAYPMPGQLIDVGGHRLHLNCTGSGSPTVVLEPGGGGMSSDLGWIAPAVARDTRVCVYDRAGRGWSEPADTPQDGAQIATDLHTLLHRANVPGPYVLAGHSFGGLYVLTFAARYPDEVAGHGPGGLHRTGTPATPCDTPGDASSSDGDGPRLRAGLDLRPAGSGPPRRPARRRRPAAAVPRRGRAGTATAGNLRSTIDEYVQAAASVQQAASLRDFTDKPLVVLTAGGGTTPPGRGAERTWPRCRPTARTASSTAPPTQIYGLRREHAAATTQAILDVVSSVRSAVPLGR